MMDFTPTPIKAAIPWVRFVALALAALLVAALVLGFIRDPFGWRKAKVENLQQQVGQQTDNASARGLEAKGEAATARRLEAATKAATDALEATATLSEAARTAPDAKTPLDPERLARLRRNDDQLCAIAALAGCTAPADHAGKGG